MHLKNKFVAFLLIVAILGGSFSRLFIYAGFELNQKYIAANLCENRDKPWLHCDGKCYFMKKIKQAEEKEKSEEGQTQKNLIQETYCQNTAVIKFHTHLLRLIITPYNSFIPITLNKTIFQPPRIG
jgi:hypothetical protein